MAESYLAVAALGLACHTPTPHAAICKTGDQ
jgi:hypothetical protein